MQRLFRWLSRRPLWLLHSVGGWAGWISYAVSGTYRPRFDANAQGAGVSQVDARRAVAEAGRMVLEIPTLWLRPADRLLGDRVRLEGQGLVEAAHAHGKGLLLLTPHLGCFEICAQAYAEHFSARYGPITVLFRPARQAWLREVMEGARTRPGLATAPASLAGVRQMIRALRQGQTVGLLPDQVPPDGMGVWAPFFGRPAYTMTLAARLSLQTASPLLLMLGERLPSAGGWRIYVIDMPEALPQASAFGGDDSAHQTACAAVINRAMEHLIRRCPQQYLWGYHRYKGPRGSA